MNHPRNLVRDSILEAIRRGASRIRRPHGVDHFAPIAHRLGMQYNVYTGFWMPTPQTHRLVVAYIAERRAGKSPLAINDYCPIEALRA